MYQFLYYFSVAYLAVAALVYVILLISLFWFDKNKHAREIEGSKAFYFCLVVISPVLMSLFWIFFLRSIFMKKQS